MSYTEEYKEHIQYTHNAFCKIVIRHGTNVIIPYQNRRQFIHELIPMHGNPKTMTDLPESERELAMILKRERFKRSYHAVSGDIKEYLEGLKNNILRGRLKEARTAAAVFPKPPSPNKGPER